MRLIDADALVDHLRKDPLFRFVEQYGMDGVIDAAPTIDAIPVVRCANCKYIQCNIRQDGSIPVGFDEYECDLWHESCDPTDFCSYAERREDETD